jgi:hypothetical protein
VIVAKMCKAQERRSNRVRLEGGVVVAVLGASDGGSAAGRSTPSRSRLFIVALVVAAIAALVGGNGAQGQEEAVLGTADNFAVLAGAAVTNTGETVVTGGDVGVSPSEAISGFPPGVVVGGIIRRNDGVAATARADAGTAYDALRSRSTECNDLTGQDLGNVSTLADPLEPGVYCFSSSAFLTGTLYLEAGQEYIFLIGSDLVTATGSSVVIVGGPQDGCNIYWAVRTSATLGTDSEFLGTIIAEASITLDPRAAVNGRLIALTGAVTLIDNDITVPTCEGATTTTAPPGATTTAPPGATTTAPPGATTTAPPGATTTAPPGATTTAPPGATTTVPSGATTTTATPGMTTTTALRGTTTTTLQGGSGAGPTTTVVRGTTTTTAGSRTTATTAPGGGTGSGTSDSDSVAAAARSGRALAITGAAGLQPMVVAGLLAVILGAMMLISAARARRPGPS